MTRIAIQLLKGNIAIRDIEEIIYFQADENVCYVFMKDGEKLISTLPLNKYTSILENDHHFFSINRSLLFNLSYLSEFNNVDMEIKMTNGVVLSVSRRGAKKLKEILSDSVLFQKNSTTSE
ncbi:MAG: LytTR family transcriptional regulator DNA-binding domain-containing protein [Saprospiraceae bacterium]|nr:LytTR family transcriptional regulator DNA-binding domain-containing protein [Saprospiraceae bacterium]